MTQTRWIDIEDYKPGKCQRLLRTVDGNVFVMHGVIRPERINGELVTHWMPMPKLPKANVPKAEDEDWHCDLCGECGVPVEMEQAEPKRKLGHIVRDGKPCSLEECRPGLFKYNGCLGLKTEYSFSSLNDNLDVYVCESGEVFWGGCGTKEKRAALIVQPVKFEAN